MVSKIVYFHPYLRKMNPFWRIFFKWVGSTTNQRNLNLGCLAGFPIFQKTVGLQGLNNVLVAWKKKNGVCLEPYGFSNQNHHLFVESCGWSFGSTIPPRSSIWWSWPLVLPVSILIGTRPHWVGENGGEFEPWKKRALDYLRYRFRMNNYPMIQLCGDLFIFDKTMK